MNTSGPCEWASPPAALGAPTWLVALFAFALLLPGLLTVLGGRASGWYYDYRVAVHTKDAPTAMDRATKLADVLEPSFASSLLARAHAVAGESERARELLATLEVNGKFTEIQYWNAVVEVLNECGDFEDALTAYERLAEVVGDPVTASQGLAIQHALFLQNGAAARPHLDAALAGRGRGRLVDLYLEATEIIVRFEEGSWEGQRDAIDRLVPEVEKASTTTPELIGLADILRGYACLMSAESDRSAAARYLAEAAPGLAKSGPKHLLERCHAATGVA